MSRTIQLHNPRRNAEKQWLCRICSAPVTGRRRSYCSAKCSDAYWQAQPKFYRPLVAKRDVGICADCGCDTAKIERIYRHAQDSLRSHRDAYGLFCALRVTWQRIGFNSGRSFWEADHIREVVRGGTSELANLQTLCCPCHKAKTKRLAAERAQERRLAKRLPLIDFEEDHHANGFKEVPAELEGN